MGCVKFISSMGTRWVSGRFRTCAISSEISKNQDKQLTTVRPEPVEGPFVKLRTDFDRLSLNGLSVMSCERTSNRLATE